MPETLIRYAVRISGLLVLLIGLAHFVMPSLGYDAGDLAVIPEAQRDHFVYLGTYAIGTFLVSFGVLTLLADPCRPSRLEKVFFALMAFVWGARFVLELLYPVDLSLFILSNPHPVLLATVLLIWAGYGLGLAGSLSPSRP